jgi:hypothetical protein
MRNSKRLIVPTILVLALIIGFWILNITNSNSPCTQFGEKIDDELITANQISAAKMTELVNFAEQNAEALKVCYPELFTSDDKVISANLVAIIKNSPEYSVARDNANGKEIIAEIPVNSESDITAKLYLERSGSMVFYDTPTTEGHFKDALTTFLTDFSEISGKKNLVYVVNDDVYPCPFTFSQLIQSTNIFNDTKQYGKADYTDFELIFNKIMGSLKGDEVGILFSDMIYSTDDMKNKNNLRVMTEAENITRDAFTKFAKDYSVVIIKLIGDYDGKYYPYNGGAVPYNGSRPYYICIMAKNATMQKLMKNEKYTQIKNFSRLPKFQNFYFWGGDVSSTYPNYTALLQDRDNLGSFNQDEDELLESNTGNVHSLTDLDLDPDQNLLKMNIVVDMSNIFLPEQMKIDTAYYEIECPQKFKVEKIIPVSRKEGTHKITLSTRQDRGGERKLKIRFKRSFPPSWIKYSHSDDDRNVNSPSFASTTFGIQNMLQGINSAYMSQTKNPKYYFELTIKLKN